MQTKSLNLWRELPDIQKGDQLNPWSNAAAKCQTQETEKALKEIPGHVIWPSRSNSQQ